MKRTPSTSAIYETLRRSKELRESLSRPSSRLSIDNIPEKMGKDVVRLDWGCTGYWILRRLYWGLYWVLDTEEPVLGTVLGTGY